MNTPEIDGLTSEDCLLQCADGKRRVGHYHCNGRWYEHTAHLSRLLNIDVLAWDYLNPPNKWFCADCDDKEES